jgi:hypothetical protein
MIFIKSLIALGCILTLNSCAIKKTYGDGKDCQPYYQYLKINWQKNDEGIFFLKEKPSYDPTIDVALQYLNKECLVDLKRQQIIELFGEPSSETEKFLKYYVMKECLTDEDDVKCAKLTFQLDEKEKVEKVWRPGYPNGPIPNKK